MCFHQKTGRCAFTSQLGIFYIQILAIPRPVKLPIVNIWATEFELLVIPLLLLSIGACIVNLSGRTGGIKYSLLLVIAIALGIAIFNLGLFYSS
jgi:hypothetical protein